MIEAAGRPAPDAGGSALALAHAGLRWAVTVTAVSIMLLAIATELPIREVLALPVFFLLLPGLALAQLPLIDQRDLERIPVYLGSALTILLLGVVAGGLLLPRGGGSLVLSPLPAQELLLWTLALTCGGLLVLGPLSFLEIRRASKQTPIMIRLLPRTVREKVVFTGLSLSAGIGEELAYRGYAFGALALLGTDVLVAILLSSASFGVLHAYQGPLGMGRAAVVGAMFTLPVVLAGSILPSMIAHALLDMLGGLVLGPRLIRRAEERGRVVAP